MAAALEFRQMFDEETHTYTYLLWDAKSKEAVLVDSVNEQVTRDVALIQALGLKLKYALETHVHADHVTGASQLRDQLGTEIVYGAKAGINCADILAPQGQELSFGENKVKVLATPGHTAGCSSFLVNDMVFTGDSLLIRGCGRTDFQQGSPETLFDSIHNQLFTLPDETKVYPGHDYKGMMSSTIGEEKALNPRLGNNKSLEDFTVVMDNLNLDYPKKLDESLPANLECGKVS